MKFYTPIWSRALAFGAVLVLSFHGASAATLYVNLTCPTPASPYSSWLTAATNIQSAIDAAVAGDQILVTNGVYSTGARNVYGMSNRVAVTKEVTVQSVNGPEVTVIQGAGPRGSTAVRCAYLTNGATLVGFTLVSGQTQNSGSYVVRQSGGGVWCESVNAVLTNCVLRTNVGYYGGATYLGTLRNCTLTGNSAMGDGGGAYQANLDNCLVVSNETVLARGGRAAVSLQTCVAV